MQRRADTTHMVNMAARDATTGVQETAARNVKAATTALPEDVTQIAVNVSPVQDGMSLMVLAAALDLQRGEENAAIGEKMLIVELATHHAEATNIMIVGAGVVKLLVIVQVAGRQPQALAAVNDAEL